MKRVLLAPFVVMLVAVSGCASLVRATGPVSQSQSWDKFTRVEVRVRNGNVELRSGGVEQIKVTGQKYAGGATAAEAQANLDRVEIYTGAASEDPDTFLVELRFPEDLRNKSVGADLVIEVPKPCAAKVATSNGSIHVARLAGNVELQTSNGSVLAQDIQGPLKAGTSNGRIEIAQVDGDVTASSSNGGVTTQDIRGACVLTTSNGDIRAVAALSSGSRVELRTSNGSIHATLPASLAAELKLRTSNGRVHVTLADAALKDVDAAKTHYHAVMNGGGGSVVAETSNGSITVDAR